MNQVDFGSEFQLCRNESFIKQAKTIWDENNDNNVYKGNLTTGCTRQHRCKRAKYSVEMTSSKDKLTNENHGKFTLTFATTEVQLVRDAHSYDAQSLIGEVGGTLGLLLGLSFSSVFDLIDLGLDRVFSQF